LQLSSVKSRSGRDSKVRTSQENAVTADDGVPSIEPVETTAMCGVSVERNEVDAIGAKLAGALHAWCGSRDPRQLRRTLLAALAALEDE